MANLAALWFGLQFVWGAILAVSLQERSGALAPADGLHAYATIAALGAVAGTLTQLAVGPAADRAFARRGGRHAYYVAGVGAAAPSLAWFYLAPSYAQLVAAFFLVQIGMNVVTGPYQAIVPDRVAPERAGSASAWMGIFAPLGNVGGLVTAGFIGAPAAVAAILASVLVGSCAVTLRARRVCTPPPAERAPLRIDRTFRTLVASRAAINFGFYTLLGFLFFFVQQSLGIPAGAVRTQTALLFIAFTVANVVGALLGGRPADRYDKRTVVTCANALVAAGLLVLATAKSVGIAYLAAVVAGVAWGAYFVADWALACTLLPRGAMAAAMSVWNVAATLPQIVAPLVTAPLVERANAAVPGSGPRAAILIAIAEFTLGALWLYRLPRR